MKTSRTLKKILNPTQNERGVVLVIAMLVVALLLLLGAHFMGASLTEHTIAANDVNAARAFYLADAGTEHARKTLETLNLSQVLDGTTTVFTAGNTVNLAGGSYTVQVTNNIAANGFPRGTIAADPSASATVDGDDIVVATSTGTFGNGQQIVETVLQTGAGSLPTIPAAVVSVSNGSNELSIENDSFVTGNEESLDPTCTSNKAGWVWKETISKLDIKNNGEMHGDPQHRAVDTGIDDPMFDDPAALRQWISDLATQPGVVNVSGSPLPGTLGTAADPQITVWDPDAGDIKGTTSGYGILIIKGPDSGTFNFKDDFSFHGLILVDTIGEAHFQSDSVIHGAVFAVSESSASEATHVEFENNARIDYNCDVVAKYVKPILGGGSMKVLSWRRP